MAERAKVLTPTESRQASSRRLNLRVLITSMALALAVGAVLYTVVYGFPQSSIGVPETPPAAPTTSTPAPNAP